MCTFAAKLGIFIVPSEVIKETSVYLSSWTSYHLFLDCLAHRSILYSFEFFTIGQTFGISRVYCHTGAGDEPHHYRFSSYVAVLPCMTGSVSRLDGRCITHQTYVVSTLFMMSSIQPDSRYQQCLYINPGSCWYLWYFVIANECHISGYGHYLSAFMWLQMLSYHRPLLNLDSS